VANQIRRLETADLLLGVLIVTSLFFYPPSMDVFNFPKQWVLFSLTLGVSIHFLFSRTDNQTETKSISRKLGWVLFLLIITIWASALFTETTWVRAIFGYPGRANGVVTYSCIIILVWISHRMNIPDNFVQKLGNRLLLVIGVFGMYSIIQFFALDPVPWNNPYNRIIGTFGNPNFSGAFLGASSCAILTSSIYGSKKGRLPKFLFALILLILAVATQSLQSMGIFLVGIGFAIVAFLDKKLSKIKMLAVSAVVASVSLASFLSFLGMGPFGDRLYQYTLRLRLEYWRIGLEIAENSPMFGSGPDSYVEGFRLFKGKDFVKTYSESVTADSAHNVLINFLANYGIPAFGLFLVLVLFITFKSLKVIFTRRKVEEGVLLVAYLWLLLLIQSLFSLEQIGLNIFQWICGALLLNTRILEATVTPKRIPDRAFTASKRTFFQGLRTEISIIVMLISLIATWGYMNQEIAIQKLVVTPAGTKLSNEDIDQRLSSFNTFSLGEIRRAIFITDFLLRVERYEDAKTLLEKVVGSDPQAFEAFEQLARIAKFQSDFNGEIAYRKKIELIDPYNYSNYLSMSKTLATIKNNQLAIYYADKVIEIAKEPEIVSEANALKESLKS